MISQTNAWLRAQAQRHKDRRAATDAVHQAEVARRARGRRDLVELIPRPPARTDPDPCTAPMTRELPVQSGESWTWLQVTFAAISWLLIAAMCLLLLAAVGLLIAAVTVCALVLAAAWVSPPYVVGGLLVLGGLGYIYAHWDEER